jgi:hypothetical protein
LVTISDELIVKELQDTENILEEITGKSTKPYSASIWK